jgi:hypothetical protein
LFGRQFVESGNLRRYILAEIGRDEANNELRFHLTDPVSHYHTWFENYERDNPIVDRRDQIADKLLMMAKQLTDMLDEGERIHADVKEALARTGNDAPTAEERKAFQKLERELKQFRAELVSPQELTEQAPGWKKLVGDKAAILAAQILFALHREKRGIKRSDAIDLIHAMYLPHTDLWRGDKAFSDLLIKHKVDFSERVVPALAELPSRIVAEIARRQESPILPAID